MRLSWNNSALAEYRQAISYIAEDSTAAAIVIQERIKKKVTRLLQHPTKYPPDRLRIFNDGSFRAFTSDSLRISYRVFKDSIHIIRVRHVKRMPLRY